jgi:Holliday junction resolvase RusA-like endonuclease
VNKVEIIIDNLSIRSYQGDGHYTDENGKTRVYTPEEKLQYKKDIALKALQWVRLAAKKEGKPFRRLTGAIHVTKLIYTFPTKKKELWGTDNRNTPDLTDNLQKPLFDALEYHIIENDKDITRMDGLRKVWGQFWQIEIELEEIG